MSWSRLGLTENHSAQPSNTLYIRRVIRLCSLTFDPAPSEEEMGWYKKREPKAPFSSSDSRCVLHHFNKFLKDSPFPNTGLTKHLPLGIVGLLHRVGRVTGDTGK